MSQMPYEREEDLELIKNSKFESMPSMVKETVMQAAAEIKSEEELNSIAENLGMKKGNE